jgi:hypothetical protein
MTSPSPAPSYAGNRPKAPLGRISPDAPQLTSFFPPDASRPSTSLSIRTVMSSSTSGTDAFSPTGESTLAIKATCKSTIVSFRTPRDVSYDEVRRRLYEKFVSQEGIPLSKTFSIAFVLPPTIIQTDHVDPARARTRSDSMSSAGYSDNTQTIFVTSQVEWEMVVASAGRTKITLRVLDASE